MSAPEGAPFEMEQLEFVLLKRPAHREAIAKDEEDRLQELHLAHLTKMISDGHMVLAGPLSDQPDEALRGLCFYRVGSIERARELAESDPAVVAGRLEVDVMGFWCPAGVLPGPQRRD